jgi:hypothetical protein
MDTRRNLPRLPRRWLAALAAGALALALGLTFFRLPRSRPAVPAASPVVQVTRFDSGARQSLLQEQAVFFDPTPLFLPTLWNASQRELPGAVQRKPDEIFGTFPAKLSFNEDRLVLQLGPVLTLPAGPRDVLARNNRDPFFTFGREAVPLPELSARGAYVEVRSAGTGELILTEELTSAAPPRTDWGSGLQPPEYMAAVDRAGLVGPPVLTTGSGSDEVDGYFRDYLARNFRVGERLAPGFYRVVIGP